MKARLERRLTFLDATLFEVGGIIGAGVFVLIGLAIGMSGPAIVLSVALAGFISLTTAVSYAEISSAIPAAGGEYEFAHKLISPLAGTLTGLGWLVADMTSSAVVSLGLASYLHEFIPALPLTATAVGAVVLVSAINLWGIKWGSRTNDVFSSVKLVILAGFIVFAALHFNAGNFAPLAPNGLNGIIAGAAIFFFAYSGFGKLTRLSEEVVDAPKVVPKAIIAALAVCTILYVLAAIALVGAVGWMNASASQAPFASAASALGAPWLAIAISVGAVAAMFSVLLTNNAGISRIVFALGRRNAVIASLGEVHPVRKTPWKAILLTGALSAIAVSFVTLASIASFASALFLLYYGIINAIALVARGRRDWKPKFYSPLFPLFPVLGLLSCAVLLLAQLLKL